MRRAALTLLAALALAAPARAASPQLVWLEPPGGRRGAEVTLRLHGRRLADAEGLVFHRPGLTLLGLEVPKKQKGRLVIARVAIAADAPLGEHPFRVRCRSGLSELRTFSVGALPELAEAEPNGDLERAQAIPLDVTVTGRVTAEDVDLFSFEGKKGERVAVEVEAQRLGGPVFDPYLALLDGRRFELAVADDGAFGGTDGALALVLPEDGRYFVELREASYGGSGRSFYRLHVGRFPRPLVALPAGGQPGETIAVRLLGEVAGADVAAVGSFTFPPREDELVPWFVEGPGGVAPTPLRLRCAPLAGHQEVEPNGRKRATAVTIPGALHGVIGKPRDRDWFWFSARKGQAFGVRVWARELGSPLDAVVNVYVRGGKHVVGNDDAGGRPDSALRFVAPADGEYELRVRDFLDGGGPAHAYRVEVAPERPTLGLTLHAFGRNSQDRQALAVPRGNRFAALLRLERRAAGGPVELALGALPAGVAPVTTPVCPAGATVVPLVLEAAPDAPLAAGLVPITARHLAKPPVAATLRHTVPLSYGAPNNAVYHEVTVDRLAVAVSEPAPFALRLEPPAAPLVREGSAKLVVAVERASGFEGTVELWLLYDPPGVGSRRRVVVKKGQDRAEIALDANARAALGDWPLVAIGKADVRGALWVASAPVTLEVAAQRLRVELTRAAASQGQSAAIAAAIEVLAPFEGEGRARLVGLPAHCAAPTLAITRETSALRFEVTVGAKAKLGKHRNVRLRVELPSGAGTIVHTLARTELRIDPPRPAPAQPAPAAAASAEPAAPPPASRLEQLRAAYRAQREREGGGEAKPAAEEPPAAPEGGVK